VRGSRRVVGLFMAPMVLVGCASGMNISLSDPTTTAVVVPDVVSPVGPDAPLLIQVAGRVAAISEGHRACLTKPKECAVGVLFPVDGSARTLRKKVIDEFVEKKLWAVQPDGKESYTNVFSVVLSDDKQNAVVVGCDWNTMVSYKMQSLPSDDGNNGVGMRDVAVMYDGREGGTLFTVGLVLKNGVWEEKDFEGKGFDTVNRCGPKKVYA
jgi:hypothetical protein